MKKHAIFSLFTLSLLGLCKCSQPQNKSAGKLPIVEKVEAQPLLAQATRLKEALSFLGSSLSSNDVKRLEELQKQPLNVATSKTIQEILDPYCISMVNINPESRVKVERGPASANLIQGGWKSFLVKIHNEAGITPVLKAESSNAFPSLHISTAAPRVKTENVLSRGQVENRFLEVQLYQNRPLQANLSGLLLEYAVVQLYSKDAGQREAELSFNVGQGSQDIGFRNSIHILFNIQPSVRVKLKVKDEDGTPAMASFTITDGIERMQMDSKSKNPWDNYWVNLAQINYQKLDKELTGIYPLPSRRVAAFDEYPDFFFQPQVYRSDGEFINLAPGKYHITFTRGPEYITQSKEIDIPPGSASIELSFQLKRWVNLADLGWYSADHHIHAAGCSHYESPEEGVPPADMWRQLIGEDLKVAAVLTWGPSWYHQKGFFTGNDDKLSSKNNIMRYDVEVSGFPSSHAGHIVLLQLKEDDYPGTTTIEEWPTWTLPVLQWAKSQGAIVGYAHSGWGLEPTSPTQELPNYILPKLDGIGANEYIVSVTQNLVDFYSAGDTPAPWELNMWYHTLNCGFRTRLSGETDFPCIFDERVGLARSYFKTDGAMSYPNYIKAIKDGRSYVTDGTSHIIDFSANGLEVGTKNSELIISKGSPIKVNARVTANLPATQSEAGEFIAKTQMHKQPYWNIERARIGKTQKVAVELLANGQVVDTAQIIGNGQWQQISFSYTPSQSAWLALRIYPSVHTNPIFVLVDQKPIRVKKSAEWCRNAVDQCWKMKNPQFRPSERSAAEAAYNKSRELYDRIIKESND